MKADIGDICIVVTNPGDRFHCLIHGGLCVVVRESEKDDSDLFVYGESKYEEGIALCQEVRYEDLEVIDNVSSIYFWYKNIKKRLLQDIDEFMRSQR